jgi:hypothetical protein
VAKKWDNQAQRKQPWFRPLEQPQETRNVRWMPMEKNQCGRGWTGRQNLPNENTEIARARCEPLPAIRRRHGMQKAVGPKQTKAIAPLQSGFLSFRHNITWFAHIGGGNCHLSVREDRARRWEEKSGRCEWGVKENARRKVGAIDGERKRRV